MRSLPRLAAPALLLLVAGLGGCGGESSDDEGTQPAPGVSSFEQGDFEDLPRPPEAEPLGPRSEQDGIVSRSFSVEGMQPGGVITYYEQALTDGGWTPLGVEELKEGFRSDWSKDEWRLRVSAHNASGLDAEADARERVLTQLSLVLSPASATTIPGEETG